MLRRPIPFARCLPLLALLTAPFLGACAKTDAPPPVFQVRTATPAVAGQTPLEVHGDWIAFLADEFSTGQDLNGDSDMIDSVAWVVNSLTGVETNIGVATRELAWLGDQLFLAVDEVADSKDWGGAPGTTERVLLRWSPGLPLPIFVDTLSQASPRALAVVGDRLFYASANVPAGAHASSVRVIPRTQPDAPREVLTDDAVGPLSPRLLDVQGGIVFFALSEPAEGRDLNDDGDSDDVAVLALLDGQGQVMGASYSHDLLSTRLAMPDLGAPLRARGITAGGRAAGFLVSEAAQGNTNLNLFDGTVLPASWMPPQCQGHGDTDALDDVLHYVRFDDWQANPLAAPIQNTGICGADRIVMTGAAVGTISPEAMEGTCSLNGDGDQDDRIFRWIRFGQAPVTNVGLLLALDVAVHGPARGVAELGERFVIQVDEAADGRTHDGNPNVDRMLLGWIDPSAAAPVWRFDHSAAGNAPSHATATWIGEIPGRTRLGVAFAESSNGQDLNGDGDQLDSVPTFAQLLATASGQRLAFPGIGRALAKNNAGIDVVNGWGFYRISEAEDSQDWTADGQLHAMVLLATHLTTTQTVYLGPLNALNRRAVESGPGNIGNVAAFLVSEAFAGDLNGDGDQDDHLVRYIRF